MRFLKFLMLSGSICAVWLRLNAAFPIGDDYVYTVDDFSYIYPGYGNEVLLDGYCGEGTPTHITVPEEVTIKHTYDSGRYDEYGYHIYITDKCLCKVTGIGKSAFAELPQLTEVHLPKSVVRVDDGAFAGSGFKSFTVPSGWKSIGGNLFTRCKWLTSLTISEGVEELGYAMFSCCASLSRVSIPSSVRNIGNFAFSGCSGLLSVEIPASVTNIGLYAFGGETGSTTLHGETYTWGPCKAELIFWGNPPNAVGNVSTECTGVFKPQYAEAWNAVIVNGYWHGVKMQCEDAPEPPKESDVLFVASSPNGYIGTVQDNKQTISVPLTIRRCFGDKEKLLSNQGLARQMELVVVGSFSDTTKVSLSFNGTYLANGKVLPSEPNDNDVWRRIQYVVDTETIRMPSLENPSQAAVNDIVLEFDRSNDDKGSCPHIAWVSLYIPAPPPIVVIHGINDSAYGDEYTSGLMEFGRELEKLGLPVTIADTLEHHGWDGVKKGAEQVGVAVSDTKSQFHVEHVNLVCHSMGGLKARCYVNDANDVLSVFQIATPNGGSAVADGALAILKKLDRFDVGTQLLIPLLFVAITGEDLSYVTSEALRDLTISRLRDFNTAHPTREDVNYRVLAGADDPLAPPLSAHTLVPHYVGLSPVGGMGHGSLVTDHSDQAVEMLKADLLSPAVIDDPISGMLSQPLSLPWAISADEYEYDKVCRQDVGVEIIEKGQAATRLFGVSKRGLVRMTICSAEGASCEWTLSSPSGALYKQGDDDVQVVEVSGLQTVTFNASETGMWALRLSTTDEKCASVVSIEEENSDVECRVSIEETNVNAGDTFKIVATAEDSEGALPMSPVVDLISPNGEKRSVAMIKKNGKYTAEIASTDPGFYSFEVSCRSESGVCFSRTKFMTGKASVPSRFEGEPELKAVDVNADGLIDVIRASFPISSASSSLYRVCATLSGTNNAALATSVSTNSFVAEGYGLITVDFAGDHISAETVASRYVSKAQLIMVGEGGDEVVDTMEYVRQMQDGGPYKETVDGIEWTFYVSGGKAEIKSGEDWVPAISGGTKGDIVIPSTLGGCLVTSLGKYAFYDCTGLAAVTIPEGVTTIGFGAFYACSGLTRVMIPSSVTSVGWYAFAYCYELANVTIPPGMTSISGCAFNGCIGLPGVQIPSGVTSIESGAFGACRGLTNVAISSSVTSIGDTAFYACSGLTSMTIPETVISIGEYAFADCENLKSVDFAGIPPSDVADDAFANVQAGCVGTYRAEHAEAWARVIDGNGMWKGLKMVPYDESVREAAVSLRNGWNWISVNVVPTEAAFASAFGDVAFAENDVIQSPDGFATYSGGTWHPNPSSFKLVAGRAYAVKKSTAGMATVMVSGTAAPAEIAVAAGWNWIGPTATSSVPLGSLTHTGGFSDGDIINSPTASATYHGGTWYGELKSIVPGSGYKARFGKAGTLRFK